MPDLKDQIRTYYEATTEPVDVDALTVEPGTVLVGPFPDAARRSAMKTVPDTYDETTPPKRPWWRGPVAAAAAFFVLLGAGVVLLAANRGGDDVVNPSDTVPATTAAGPTSTAATATTIAVATSTSTSVDAQFPDRVAAIEATIQAWNEGDFDTWREYLSDQAVLFEGVAAVDEDFATQRALLAAGEQWSIDGPCEDLGPDRIRCRILRTSDFGQPARVAILGGHVFSFDADGRFETIRLSAADQGSALELLTYARRFDAWLLDAYPQVHASFGDRVFGDMPNARDMPIALQYVDEFVAQSDVYPLGE